MLTKEAIKNLKHINMSIVREALNQAEKKLTDVIETKKQIEQKAFILFNGYLTLLIGEISASFVVKTTHPNLFYFLVSLIPFFVLSLILIVVSLHSYKYGSLGSNPSMWLEKTTLEGNENSLKVMLGYITFYHQDRIKQSIQSNDAKLMLINLSAYSSLVGLIISLTISLIFSLL